MNATASVYQITAATCDYGLAKVNGTCSRTFATYCHSRYHMLQIMYCVLGVLAFALSGYKYVAAVKNLGSFLQRRAFLLAMYCSFTFIARGIDPGSYGHFVPRPVVIFFTDTCTASLYSVFIMSLSFWISIIQGGAGASCNGRSMLKIIEYTAHFAVWAFYIICSMSMIDKKGYGGVHGAVQMLVTALMLLIISTAFVVYGFRILRRLEYIASLNRAVQSHRTSCDSDFETGEQSPPSSLLYKSQDHHTLPPPQKFKPSERIRRMLYLIGSVSLIAILSQVYVAYIALTKREWTELACANGHNCHKLRVRVQYLHILQFTAILLICWAYRKIRKRDDESHVAPVKNPVQLI